MQKKTYVSQSLQKGRLIRWTYMPLTVYIAPMKFYSKKGEDYKYNGLVTKALNDWQAATKNRVSFKVVPTLLESCINIDWKRVDRQALGLCQFSYDGANRLAGAEVSIGLTDGLIHKSYDNEEEVYHTILHEIGHAIGLGHSPFKTDIMYTPHQKGIHKISDGDILTVNWLYKLPQGATTQEIASMYSMGGSDIDEIIARVMDKNSSSEFEKVKKSVVIPKRDLLEEQENIALLRKYHMALQNINISDDIKKTIIKNSKKGKSKWESGS